MIIRKKPPRQARTERAHPPRRIIGRPRTRRDFLGRASSPARRYITAPTFFSLFANPRLAEAALATDIQALADGLRHRHAGRRQDPFICL